METKPVYLGQQSSEPIDHLDSIPAPKYVTNVHLESTECTAKCPVTGQPDFYTVVIEYKPERKLIETKSLKLYLQSYRERGIFAENLASEILGIVRRDIHPISCQVWVEQNIRGGITLEAEAEWQST